MERDEFRDLAVNNRAELERIKTGAMSYGSISKEAHEAMEMARGLIRLSSIEAGHEKSYPAPRDVPTLTGRQLEVLQLLASGKSARDIGTKLYLSQATVRNHIRALLQGLGAHSQLEALARAREFGLLAR